MGKILLSLLKKAIDWLQFIYSKFSDERLVLPYNSLSPIDTVDEDKHYTNMLRWALKNRNKEDIKNIALTGPYGSGKTSILKTFQKNYPGRDLHFLDISLATFKEEKQNGNGEEKSNTELLRLIEISILQQIFYREKDSKIPDSRFKKIRSYKFRHLLLASIGLLLFVLSTINLFKPTLFQSFLKDFPFGNLASDIIHYSSHAIILLGILVILFKSIRIISSITISKLKFQNTEIGLGDNLNKSILNHHLNEILYFFAVRPYNVVIIEDLDRFRETEIFTKLREINLLLNKSEKTKEKNIVFIYAVRDEMFTDKDRTKFFDFIIPVIPAINSSNSSQIFLDIKEKYNFTLSENLIDDLSLFIDDMRLLHNIINEFFLYKQKLEDNLVQDKLLAILVYKNICPNDFVGLSNNKGDLYKCLNSKTTYINAEIDKIDNEINELKHQIKNLEKYRLTNVKELRSLYILQTIKHLEKFHSFEVKGNSVNVEELAEDVNFNFFKNDDAKCSFWYIDRQYCQEIVSTNKPIGISFQSIENEVDSKSYNQREQEIDDWHSNKIDRLKNKIQTLENKKINIRGSKIKDIIQLDLVSSILSSHIELINIMLRNGYIAEDYLDYISFFYPGSISRTDNQFLICVKGQKKLEFDFRLNKIEKLISKISPIDFKAEYILNYDLVEYLLGNNKAEKERELIFSKITDESAVSLEFIDGFLDRTTQPKLFVKILCNGWYNIWDCLYNNSNFTEAKKEIYLKYILEYAEISDIKKIHATSSSLSDIILKNENFLKIISTVSKLKKIIKAINPEFKALDFQSSPQGLSDFVYENNFYELNTEMIKSIVKYKGSFNQVSFDHSNYSSIKKSKCDSLVSYIDNNLDTYIEDIYLKIEPNNNEGEEYLSLLLNNEDIDIENRKLLIQKVNTKITKLDLIESVDLKEYLLSKNKMESTWENIFDVYQNVEEHGSEHLISFIDNLENAEELSKVKIPTKVDGEDLYGSFWKELIQTDSLSDSSYKMIIKSNPWWYKDLEITSLSTEKVEALIENRVLKLGTENFETLKSDFKNLHIRFIEEYKSYFLENLSDYDIDTNDIELILKSDIFNSSEKNTVLLSIDEDTILENDENLKAICELAISGNKFILSDSLVEEIVLCSEVSSDKLIRFYNINWRQIDASITRDFIDNLGEPFSIINIKGKRPSIEESVENTSFLSNLKIRGVISNYKTVKNKLKISTFLK